MTRFIEVLISLAIVAALFLVVSLVLPSSRHLSEKTETNRKLTIVYDTLNSMPRFKDWTPLVLYDPRMQLKLSGPDSGVGARLDYDSKVPRVGQGSWEITATDPGKSVSYAIVDPRRGNNKRTSFLLKPVGRGVIKRNVEITQTYDVDYGWDLLGRYAGLYVSRHVGDDIKLGLQRLSNMLASVPNVDYRAPGSKLVGLKVVDRPAEDLLVVSAGSIERNDDLVKASVKSNMEWINRTIAASGLVAAGPMRIISTELGRENYTFDVALPVRRADSSAGNAPLSGLKLQGPVQYVRTKGGRAATGSYTGYIWELDNVRNAIRAWALTQGLEVTDRPYEVYKNGIDQALSQNGEYDVYWTIK
jgi:hypothetical protein